jgi:aryl-alcohol dehydrogenase-like predicted oxidoreductase
MANPLIAAKLSRVWITNQVYKPLMNCVHSFPAGWTMPQFALRWILMFDAVTCTIPGAKNPTQAEDNVKAAEMPALSSDTMEKIRALYDVRIRNLVHNYW